MTPLEAYRTYVALRSHFVLKKYDYFKAKNKLPNLSQEVLNNKPQRFCFEKLAKKKDPEGFLLANFVEYGAKIWIGELVTEEKYQVTFKKWLARKESLSYIFQNEVDRLDDDFAELVLTNGDYPQLFYNYLNKSISPETLAILDSLLGFIEAVWVPRVADHVLFPGMIRNVIRYRPFVEFDRPKMKRIIKQRWLQE